MSLLFVWNQIRVISTPGTGVLSASEPDPEGGDSLPKELFLGGDLDGGDHGGIERLVVGIDVFDLDLVVPRFQDDS